MSAPPPPPPKPAAPADVTEPTFSLPALPDPPFVPAQLHTKSREDLQYLLHSPPLLNALFHTTHPIAASTSSVLTSALTTNLNLTSNLQTLETQLDSLRDSTQQKLLETKQLERVWRDKEKEMYQALQPYSSVAQEQRLRQAAEESEKMAEDIVERFLAGDGEVEEFLKTYREVRKVQTLRKERGARWREGRVAGWR
ncbi:hypothetical protein FPQ18DRAFT_424317 [Pyronema domesticum]|uniref:Similar to Vacuolar protein sorting-associated protein 37A acc. no. Q8CHS8 n=1 Tax=Pyronema omphalodes (strain CBS 100304) TaxID=1076935 RepID=U4KXS6_PYROM|nr:hypothetical protein FPQ18DRAFT_424317 [Pyronema domesticum]CCX06646.1 Similar to Vacuolar protein sorting-associated protein 37A; acc. no. Q8CHS8 [Pyronema omphalodes CBS 100304]